MIKRLLICEGRTHTMYSLGTGFSWVASLIESASLQALELCGRLSLLRNTPAVCGPEQSRQAGTELLSRSEECCDLLCFPLYCHHLPSAITFAVLGFLEAIKTCSHHKSLGSFFMSFKSLTSKLEQFVQGFGLHRAFMW